MKFFQLLDSSLTTICTPIPSSCSNDVDRMATLYRNKCIFILHVFLIISISIMSLRSPVTGYTDAIIFTVINKLKW